MQFREPRGTFQTLLARAPGGKCAVDVLLSGKGLRVPLPPESLAISQPESMVQVGDVWWIPPDLAFFPGGKGRFCLVVAFESAAGSHLPARVHYVSGSRSRGAKPEIVLEAGEAKLAERTHFSFWTSGDIGVPTLTAMGRYVGRLSAARLNEITTAIRASRRAALKRLVNG